MVDDLPARLPDLHHVFPVGPDAVRATLVTAMTALRRGIAPGIDLAAAELVLAEALNNVVEHACRGLPGRVAALEIWAATGGLDVRITDNGLPMRDDPSGANPMPPAASLPEGGFGWPIIRGLTRDLHYCRGDGLNCLSFRLPARADAPLAPKNRAASTGPDAGLIHPRGAPR